jgi:hypothetical protein
VGVPQLGTSGFIIPGARVKNGSEWLVVLNTVARGVIARRRACMRRTSSATAMTRFSAC